jgi:hypothetical protein
LRCCHSGQIIPLRALRITSEMVSTDIA